MRKKRLLVPQAVWSELPEETRDEEKVMVKDRVVLTECPTQVKLT